MLFTLRSCLGVGLLSLLVAGTVLGGSPPVVAVGDVHGDVSKLTEILKGVRLVDESGAWVGGKSVLVQTGDFLDRGAQVKQVMDLLMRLQREAPRSGGEVIVLLGNHEMMNIVGDLRYVARNCFASFATQESESRLQSAFEGYLELSNRQLKRLGEATLQPSSAVRAAWFQVHPPGSIEYSEAMGPNGKYGKWLRRLPAVVKVQQILFAHGGLHPNLTDLTLDQLNTRMLRERETYDTLRKTLVSQHILAESFNLAESVEAVRRERAYLAASLGVTLTPETKPDWEESLPPRFQKQARLCDLYLDMGNWLSVHPQGPLWLRDYSSWSDAEGLPLISEILSRYQARYFVVGHTIADKARITERFGGKVFLIDTLRPSALTFADGRFEVWTLPEAAADPSVRP